MAFISSPLPLRAPQTNTQTSLPINRPLTHPRSRRSVISKAEPAEFAEDYIPLDSSTTPDLISNASPSPSPPDRDIPQYSDTPRDDNAPQPDFCAAEILFSPSLQEYREQREAGLVPTVLEEGQAEWNDAWALSVSPRKAHELANQYSRVGVLIAANFDDFRILDGCAQRYSDASIEEIAYEKAKMVFEGTGLPAISEICDLAIDAPESGSRVNKSLQQGYYTRQVEQDADEMIERVRPISDENRMTRFRSAVAYYDGQMEFIKTQDVGVAIVFSGLQYATIATTAALDEIYKELTRRLGLKLDIGGGRGDGEGQEEGEDGKVLVGATLLKERILRDGKMLNDSIIKVSSFLNHMVDTELMVACGDELAERLRHTMPNKLLTVESTGLIVGLPTARELGIPLVFARKSRPITISDSYQTTYRSATKGTTHELIVSCEYLEAGDRVIIVDDFLAGGSTAEALFKLANMAHAKVVGVGVLIEKMSEGGRAFLSGYDVPVESLAKMLPCGEKRRISFVEEEPWTSPLLGKRAKGKAREKAVRASAEAYTRESREDPNDENDEGVDVLRWEDEEEYDEIEETLIREVGHI